MESFGASVIEDFTWKQLMDTDSCTMCGRCTAVCPASATGKSLDPREIVLKTGGKTIVKTIVAGDEVSVRAMQPERVSSAFEAILWPAEDTLTGTGLEKISFVYPESDLGWLPLSGPLGVLAAFVLASMVVGFIFLKPLGVQI